MNVQEVLENYNIYKLRISIANSEIEELKSTIYDLKSTHIDGLPKAKGYSKSQLEEKIINTQEKIDKKQQYINKLRNEIKIVEDLVRTLKKYNQDIIEMKYYKKMSIEEIAKNKNRTYRSIQNTIDTSIAKMQLEYIKNS